MPDWQSCVPQCGGKPGFETGFRLDRQLDRQLARGPQVVSWRLVLVHLVQPEFTKPITFIVF